MHECTIRIHAGMPLALITKPHTKYLREGDNGTIAACFEFTLTPVFRSDIRWYQINRTTMTQIPNRNMHSEVWSTGYILKATNVKPKNSGNYCCLASRRDGNLHRKCYNTACSCR